MSKGKLIVLEGIDGSGKSAQYRRICEKLKRDGIDYSHIVFPRYDKESSVMIRMYLSGEFGEHPGDVNAYTASTFYAVDRFASFKQDWGEKYLGGGVILSDRYTTSNAVHQGSKLPENELSDLADLFKVFGDSTRIKILYSLFDTELCVSDMATILNLSQSSVSHQLRILKDAKLVKFRREGKSIFYALDDEHVRMILSLGMEHVEE